MAVYLSPVGGVAAQFFDNNGIPLAGGLIYTYAAGTSTPAVTYTSSSGIIAHSNPIVLDASGRVPTGEIWLSDALAYKFVIKTAQDVLIASYDNISGINSNFVAYTSQQEIQTATAGQTLFTLTTMTYQPGTNNLAVYVDGVNQYGPGAQYAYVETSSTSVTFVSGLHVGASVKFTTATPVASAVANAENVAYDPPFFGAVATNVQDKLAQTVSVKDFGAVGDGVTDDTQAIQNAYDYIAPRHGILHFPLGNYICSGIDLGSAADNRACTFTGDSFDFLTAYLGDPHIDTFPVSKITLKNGSNRPLFTIVESWGFHTFENLLLLGNKDNQTTPAYIIHLNDTATYKAGIKMNNVYMQEGSGGGLYIGRNRGSSALNGLGVQDCGTTSSHHGIYVNCYDTYLSDLYLGKSFGYNLYIDHASQVYLYGVNSYQAKEGGVYLGSNCNGIYVAGGSFDRNEKYGIYIEAETPTDYFGNRFISGVRFLGNSNAATGTYSDVYVNGASSETVFTNCDWQGEAGTGNPKPKYYLEFNNASAKTRLIGCKLDSTGYTTALTNQWTSIQSNDLSGFEPMMMDNANCSVFGSNYPIVVNKSTGQVSFGFSSYDGVSVRNLKAITGAAFSGGYLSDGTIRSDVTTSGYYYKSTSNTQATAFTISAIEHFRADQGTFGAGSSVTNQFGFYAASSLTGATNNFGFVSDIPNGSNRYNFFARGTAPSHFEGFISSPGSYNTTTGAGANTYISPDGVFARSTSSAKYKTQIENLENTYSQDLLNNLRPVWYRSTCERDNKSWSWYGFIAEEVAKIDPRLVHWGYPTKTIQETIEHPAVYGENGSVVKESYFEIVDREVPDTDAPLQAEGVMYDRMTVMLFDIAQQQEKRLKSLEARLNALENKG